MKRDWAAPLVFGAFAAALLLSAGLAHGHHGPVSTAEWIAEQEGLRLTPYQDSAGVWTVCVGHTGMVEITRTYTRAECLDLLDADLLRFRDGVEGVVTVTLVDSQMTALISLAFNVGLGAFGRSKLVDLINEVSPEWRIVNEWLTWSHAHVNGRAVVVDGLLERRRREVALYYGGE